MPDVESKIWCNGFTVFFLSRPNKTLIHRVKALALLQLKKRYAHTFWQYSGAISYLDTCRWFDSGSSWAACTEQNEALNYPADLYLEGSDQHRGWFQSSLLTSVAVNGHAPYRNVLTHGFVLDERVIFLASCILAVYIVQTAPSVSFNHYSRMYCSNIAQCTYPVLNILAENISSQC